MLEIDNNNNNNFLAKAFISCSLRDEDTDFINLVENILKHYRIQPFGTVGRHSASPQNPAQLMRENIPKADLVVIIATPRYQIIDLKTGNKSLGVSEMVHVESGMAYMANKPVIVFVQKGTDIGNFLPNVTQYIILEHTEKDLEKKWNLIENLINKSIELINNIKSGSTKPAAIIPLVKNSLMVYGGYNFFEYLLKK